MNLREQLRNIAVFPAQLPTFDTMLVPRDPATLFRSWLEHALLAGQPAPQVMTLSTASRDGEVSARNLILKDIDERGWQFATHSTSPKAQEVAGNPHAALTFFWPLVGRQIRVSGAVRRLPAAEAAADFRARPIGSRAATLVGRQSEPVEDEADIAVATREARAILESEPETLDENWALYTVEAAAVEFWQASHGRDHMRLLYSRVTENPPAERAADWLRTRLWP